MRFQNRKRMLSRAFALVLAIIFVAGALEVTNMMGGPSVAYEALGSDGDYVPPSGDSGSSGGSSSGGSSSASSSTSSKSSKTTAKKSSGSKKANTMKVKKKDVSVSAASLAKGKRVIRRAKAMSIKKAKGKLTFKKLKGNKKITINKKTGNITIKKGLKKGTYKIRIKVRAAGTSKYRSKSYTFYETIKVVGSANTLSAAGKTVELNKEALDAADSVIRNGAALTVSNPKGAVTYSKKSGDASISVNAKTGDITVAKGLAEGTYEVMVEVCAAGNSIYNSKCVTATVTVVVKAD